MAKALADRIRGVWMLLDDLEAGNFLQGKAYIVVTILQHRSLMKYNSGSFLTGNHKAGAKLNELCQVKAIMHGSLKAYDEEIACQ